MIDSLRTKFKLLQYFLGNIYSIQNPNQLFRGEHVPYYADKILYYYNYLYCDPHSIKDGDIIYCDTHKILEFKDLLNLRNDLIIFTHNSDFSICDDNSSKEMSVNVNLFNCYNKWFAQNSYSKNEKVFPIPIGFENKKWEKKFGPKTIYIEHLSNSTIVPKNLVYFNCNLNTNLKERKICYDFSLKSNYVTVDHSNLLYSNYLLKIKQHKFTMSPRGNGLDCHRTWEILKMKRIPILKREGQLEKLYANMPVLFVDDWVDLDYINLDQLYQSYDFNNQDYLKKSYWFKVFSTL